MPRPRRLVECRFLPYRLARTSRPPGGAVWIDVSSDAEEPFNQLSPFFPHGGIPVPGMPGMKSDSVEGIWQGLKVIRGKIAPRYFAGVGHKRGGKPAGHQWGEQKRLLSLVEARRKIYIPAYVWMLDNCVNAMILDEFVDQAFRGLPQFFYDKQDNGVIEKDEPLAHASVLVTYLNCRIAQRIN
jgi:hypothetical protein